MWFYYSHHNNGNNHLGRVTIDLLFNTEIKDFLRSDQHISFLTKYLEIKCVKLSINSSKMKIMGTFFMVGLLLFSTSEDFQQHSWWENITNDLIWFDLLCLTPLSAIFQLYHGDQFKTRRSRSTRREPPTMGKRVECTRFCN